MSVTTQTGFTNDAFERFLAERDEPAWLRDLRADAWKKFGELPMPSQRDEEWMRTDIRLLRLDKFGFPSEPATGVGVPDGLLTAGVALGGQAAALDSQPHQAKLEPKWAERGVLFGSLDELVREHGDLIKPHLFRAFDPGYDRFAALHTAASSGSMLLYVPRGVTIDEPLHMLSVLSDGAADFGHALVILEDGAEATLLAETASLSEDATGLHCGAVELLVGAGARLRYVNFQNWAGRVWHFAHQKARVDRDASLQWTIAALGAKLAKVNQHVALSGPGANAQVNGVMFTEGRQHLAYNTLQHHEAPHCRSDLLYKAALQDASRTVWRGMIRVDAGAQKTDGYQRNDNLMLSDESRSDSIPGLEIEADDVRCTHGSTTGRVDDEQIFYARCRGLTRKEAVRMVVAGFFQQVFDRITIESVREALGEAIGRRIREYE
ncbi:MAG: Fe-S cluster assembly protein SufD [Planctomycetota bacterium]|nr:MAG: Fe-S cluster assembly protein SufD [Planctomycetota bacterium]